MIWDSSPAFSVLAPAVCVSRWLALLTEGQGQHLCCFLKTPSVHSKTEGAEFVDLHLAGFWLVVLAVPLISSLMRVPWCLQKLSSNSSLSLGSDVNVISLLLIF